MTQIVLPHTLANGGIPDADQVMANLNAIKTAFNTTGITNENVAAAAAIASSKIAFAADSISATEIAVPTVTTAVPSTDYSGAVVYQAVCSLTVPTTGYYILKADSHFSCISIAGATKITQSEIWAPTLIGDAKYTALYVSNGDTVAWNDTIVEFSALTAGATVTLFHSRTSSTLKSEAVNTTLTILRLA